MAEREDGHVVLESNEARQGKPVGAMRYVLPISIGLAVIAGVVVYFVH